MLHEDKILSEVNWQGCTAPGASSHTSGSTYFSFVCSLFSAPGAHTIYLSILGRHPTIQACKRGTKNASTRDKIAKNVKMGQKLAFSMLKGHRLEKSTSPAVMAVLTNMIYALYSSCLQTVTHCVKRKKEVRT